MDNTIGYNLRLPFKAAQLALSTGKLATDCFGFCVLVKLTYGSSCIHNATVRRCKDVFHIGSTRMNQIIKYGLANGYLRREGTNLIANPLEIGRGEYAARFNLPLRHVSGNENHICAYRLNDVIDRIRQIVLTNSVYLSRSIRDAELKVGAKVKATVRRRAKKLLSRVPKTNKRIDKGLSVQTAANNVYVSKSKARKLLRGLVSNGYLLRGSHVIPMPQFDVKNCVFDAAVYNDEDNNLPGFLFRAGNKMYLNLAPVYDVTYKFNTRYHRKSSKDIVRKCPTGYGCEFDSFRQLNFLHLPEFK